MSVRNISVDQLRKMEDQEGLVLQGCGGLLQEWQDGINQILTEEGILQGGTKFEDISVFQHEGRTCLLFPFTPEVQLDIGKLAMWRLKSRDQFEGIWLSDYVDIKLGGYVYSQQTQQKPDCPLIGQDGNIFNLMGIASRTLKENGISHFKAAAEDGNFYAEYQLGKGLRIPSSAAWDRQGCAGCLCLPGPCL